MADPSDNAVDRAVRSVFRVRSFDKPVEALLESLDGAVRLLAKYGIEVSPSTRRRRYQRLLEGLLVRGSSAAPSTSHLRYQAYQEIQQFCLVAVELGPVPEFRKKLREALSGHELPEHDKNPLSRNTQFELFIAALCRRAGLHPRCEEPDVAISLQGWRIGIAAKRIRSQSQVARRMREASNQLVRARLPGVVAMDITQVLRAQNESVRCPTTGFALTLSSMVLDYVAHDLIPTIVKNVNLEHVVALLLVDSLKYEDGELSRDRYRCVLHRKTLVLTAKCDPRTKRIQYMADRISRVQF